ncbi:minor capsid protein [Bacillus litorisediminis]|uniref:minor capsid protein n=1 Tax=Bacillus litorisediminis TaxID=2922713 RepID=UPI001FAEAFED|nr:minor capsid protein [Bacillus litorisediminis]
MNKMNDQIIKVIESLFKKSESDHMEVLKLYKKSKDKIINFFNQLFVKYGKDGKIDYADIMKYNRLETIKKFLEGETQNNASEEIAVTIAILTAIFSSTYYQHAFIFEKFIDEKIRFKKLKENLIHDMVSLNWNGIVFTERIVNNHTSMSKALMTEFTQGLRRNESVDGIAKRVEKLFSTRLIHSNSLILTESTRIIGAAQEEFFKDSGIVEGVKFTAILDNQTTEFCWGHDGLRYTLDDPNRPYLPAHINCRSVWTPILLKNIKLVNHPVSLDDYDDWYEENID